MRRNFLIGGGLVGVAVSAGVGLGVAARATRGTGGGAAEPAPLAVEIVAPSAHESHGEPGPCAGSCSLAHHPIPHFTEERYRATLAAYAAAEPNQESEALDTLLFYGQRTEELMAELGVGDLSDEHERFLRTELSRRFAVVEIRMVDAADRVYASYGPMSVPLGHKQHLQADPHNLQPLEFSGTVIRTGINYVWSRY